MNLKLDYKDDRLFFLILLLLLLTVGKTGSFHDVVQPTELSIAIDAIIQEHEQKTELSGLNNFMSKWDTTLISGGSSDSNQIRLPLEEVGRYDFVINWGDETIDNITSWDQAEVTHTYETEGIYYLSIEGTIEGWRFANDGDRLKILDISEWGDLKLGNSAAYFAGAAYMQITASDAPDFFETTILMSMFYKAFAFNSDISHWNVSGVVDMSWMFCGARTFNQPLGDWDVSSVTDMTSIFEGASSFDQEIGYWDVSSVTDMDHMFARATSFNQYIGNWDVSNVVQMKYLFKEASSFNQSIEKWDVSSAKTMWYMFDNAVSFNQDIGNWDVSNVTGTLGMFESASSFNRDISKWDITSVNDMSRMFAYASSFDQDIGDWNVSGVFDMFSMFLNVTLSTENYDSLLISWSELPLQSGVHFHGGNSLYSNQAADSRQKIIDEFGWMIEDGGDLPFLQEISILKFYTVGPLLLFVVIRLIVIKKKYPKNFKS